jgi:hypothetical protein
MKKRFAVLGGAVALAAASAVQAAPGTPSIGINFASDEPAGAGSAVTGAAGVLNTVIWNNLTTANGTQNNLNADNLGVSTPTAASVTWSSPNTWSSRGRGEENNTAPAGNSNNLMTGYLDTGSQGGQGVSIALTGLPIVSPTYDVYVYIQGGVNGRGGNYAVAGQTKEHTVTGPFTGTFVEDTIDPGSTAGSNYLVFHGLTGTSFTLTSDATVAASGTDLTQRAGINAIEIVAVVPEPGALAFVGLGAGALLARRRRA